MKTFKLILKDSENRAVSVDLGSDIKKIEDTYSKLIWNNYLEELKREFNHETESKENDKKVEKKLSANKKLQEDNVLKQNCKSEKHSQEVRSLDSFCEDCNPEKK